jgi:FKBP-type peptidyl-prolyl cis-trans isomerase 2
MTLSTELGKINIYLESNFGIMQNKKIILFIIVIVGFISVFLIVTYGGNIINNLNGKKSEEKVIALGDCADINYIGRYVSNNTIFNSSYTDPINKTGGKPFKIFMSWNESQKPPAEYENYTQDVKGLIKGLVGLKEGDLKTIGPISPADAYGIYPKEGDNFTIFDPTSRKDINIQFVNIITNSTMPKEYITNYGNGKTTLFIIRFNTNYLGEKITIFPSWKNATVVTKINETKSWAYTTPPENIRENFTWISINSNSQLETIYWVNASSVTSINDTTILVTHSPKIGATMNVYSMYDGSTKTLTAVNITAENIIVSYADQYTGNISYYKINRTITIARNESQNITSTFPTQKMEEFLSSIKKYDDPNLTFSVDEHAGKYLIYEVQIVKIYKIS